MIRVRGKLVGCGALASLLLAACSPITSIPPLRKDVPLSWRNAPVDSAKLGPAPDLDSWWHGFHDAQLDRLIERALAQNLTLQQAQLRLRSARAMQHRSGTQFRPELSFHTFSQPDPAATTSYYEIGFDAQWEFGFFGRGLGNARVAAADLRAAATDIDAARVSVVAEVARSYADLRAAQTRAAILDHIVELRQRSLDLDKVRLRLHLTAAAEVDKLEADLAQAQADAAESAQPIVAAQQTLAVLLAETGPDASLLARGPQPIAPDTAFAQTPADLLRTRPEIRAAELNVLRAAGELGIAKADLYPKLALGGTLISSTRVVGDIDRPNKAIPSAGPMIDIPLFDWGARRDVVRARGANLKATVLAYRQAVLEGVAEAETALAQWHSQRQRLVAADTLLATSEHAIERTRKLQRIGLADAADSAAADTAAAQAQLQHTLVEHDAALAYIAVYKSFGGTLPPLRMDAH
jgi:NodT family efflux transporter outer membrane factor (OMF) lipoprotein